MLEIYSRGEALQWMNLMHWPIRVQEEIFIKDNPDVEKVRELVYRHGPERALKIILELFLS